MFNIQCDQPWAGFKVQRKTEEDPCAWDTRKGRRLYLHDLCDCHWKYTFCTMLFSNFRVRCIHCVMSFSCFLLSSWDTSWDLTIRRQHVVMVEWDKDPALLFLRVIWRGGSLLLSVNMIYLSLKWWLYYLAYLSPRVVVRIKWNNMWKGLVNCTPL